MATLYEINSSILECIDAETGEVIDTDKLEALTIEKANKIEQVGLWYKNLLSDAEAYKAEKAHFAAMETAAKNKAESLKKYMMYALNGEKFKTDKLNVTYRKSETVEVDDVLALPIEYQRIKPPEPNKDAIKKAFKAGTNVSGARLVDNTSIQIK